jgi:hypothetical protein
VVVNALNPILKRNPASGRVALLYLRNNSQDVYMQEWDGSAWLPEELVYSAGSGTMMQLTLCARNDQYWGLAYSMDDSTAWLIEEDGGGWGAPQLLSNTLLNDYCGLGLAYSPDGDCAVTLERGDPQKFYVGERQSGESAFSWTMLDDTTNGYVRGTLTFYEGSERPIVFYYRAQQFEESNGIYVLENIDNEWTTAHFDFVYWNSPLGTAVDSLGNIVVSGVYGNPAQAVYTVIWR